ncbi:hypothetical protein RI054_05g30510 [Pseudoscourfieldia marina]
MTQIWLIKYSNKFMRAIGGRRVVANERDGDASATAATATDARGRISTSLIAVRIQHLYAPSTNICANERTPELEDAIE